MPSSSKTTNQDHQLASYEGCLFGVGVGDALGAPVEFRTLGEIRRRFGDAGVTRLHGWGRFPPGYYTDDMQMTLATARGLLRAAAEQQSGVVFSPIEAVYEEYTAWYKLQSDERMNRAPGTTCLSALASGRKGTIDHPINDSKGCGGVMRTTPVGLALPAGPAFRIGAECAALTHGHPSGYLPAGVLSALVAGVLAGRTLDVAIDDSVGLLIAFEGHEETLEFIERAREEAASGKTVEELRPKLSSGWTGESALAIALYCSLKYADDWSAGTLAAVNHSGDSDSTGSITGGILGTLLGIEAIPREWVSAIEDASLVAQTARRMQTAFGRHDDVADRHLVREVQETR